MPTSIATIQIEAPLAEVFRYISTQHLLSEWIADLRPGSRVGGDGEVKLGMRSSDPDQITGALPDADIEVNGFEPDHSISMHIESAGFIMHTRFHLFESDGVTTVRQSVKLSYKSWYRLFVAITNRSVQKRIDASLVQLKALLEQSDEGAQSDRAA